MELVLRHFGEQQFEGSEPTHALLCCIACGIYSDLNVMNSIFNFMRWQFRDQMKTMNSYCSLIG